ncbi:type IV pilus assembly protein PilE [Inhella inkyongensis]|uniref:Type IV pilus assembly protein PilE n=1 Tax=Inhella inkyongensis TaxID=392593 RepID=A0A840S386_9BURK|nr:type IV pilin protein [Inhella inkyongensis]MBB5204193.1 type IV pilus assembly protein PilE [Inhella inkyongensis]
MRNHSTAAFTLIEVMIVVALLAVLAALAYPSYQDAVRKGRRSDGFDALIQVQQAQERHRSNNPAYASALSDLGHSGTSSAGYYELSLTSATTTGYVAVAKPKTATPQAADKTCAELKVTIERLGSTRSAVDSNGTDSTARCWPN